MQSLCISIRTEEPSKAAVLVPSHDVVCDFLDGWALGNAFGIGVRSAEGWWTVKSASLANPYDVSYLCLLS